MNKELYTNNTDREAEIIKQISSLVPGIGGIVGTLITSIIPNQRMDRIAKFVEMLYEKIKSDKEEVFKIKMQLEAYIDLFEDCIIASTRALTDERKNQIANLFVNGLKDDDINRINSKKLLQILNQIDDLDLMILKFLMLRYNNRNEEAEKLRVAIYKIQIPELLESKEMLFSRQKYLDSLGLVTAIYKVETDKNEILFSTPRYSTILLFKEIGIEL